MQNHVLFGLFMLGFFRLAKLFSSVRHCLVSFYLVYLGLFRLVCDWINSVLFGLLLLSSVCCLLKFGFFSYLFVSFCSVCLV